jgi:hypothetical protein
MPKPLPKASHSKTKVLVKYGTANTRVMHTKYFKVEKAYSMAPFKTKELCFSSKVKGETIFPYFFTNFL